MGQEILDELVSVLGFELSDDGKKVSQEYEALLANTTKAFNRLALAATATAGAIAFYTNSVANSVNEQTKFAQALDISFEGLQKWGLAAELLGGSQGSLKSTLTTLAELSAEAVTFGGEGAASFAMVGVSLIDTNGNLKDSLTLFKEVSGALAGMDPARQRALAGRLGIGNDLMLLIREGPEALERLTSGAKVITSQEAEIAERYRNAMLQAGNEINNIGKMFALRLLPVATDIAEQFNAWADTSDGIAAIETGVSLLEAAMRPLAIGAGLASVAMLALGVATTAWVAPLLIGVAAVGALAIAIDEIIALFEGRPGIILKAFDLAFDTGGKARPDLMLQALLNPSQIPQMIIAERFNSQFGPGGPLKKMQDASPGGGIIENVFNIVGSDPKEIAEEVMRRMETTLSQGRAVLAGEAP